MIDSGIYRGETADRRRLTARWSQPQTAKCEVGPGARPGLPLSRFTVRPFVGSSTQVLAHWRYRPIPESTI